MEIRSLPGSPGYEVSDQGDVFGRKGKLKPWTINSGYLTFCVRVGGVRSNITVHRAVASAFVPNPEGREQVNHKNGNKLDNRAENLEWVDASGNSRHSYDTGLNGKTRSVTGRCVETGAEISYRSASEAQRLGGFQQAHISRCCLGRPDFKSHKGYSWRFSDV